MTTTEIMELSDYELRAFLARNHTGRIAYSLHGDIEIQPISYSYDNGWIMGRTSVGTKLSALSQNPWCAFEVDEVSNPFEWISVVARGAFHLLDPEWGSPDVYARALASVGAMIPDAFSPEDPVPHRNILFGICVSEMTGRRARRHARAVATPALGTPALGTPALL
ncbi:MAG: pyridoxamine 5'-phosphate oxidase family protein [bacterium]